MPTSSRRRWKPSSPPSVPTGGRRPVRHAHGTATDTGTITLAFRLPSGNWRRRTGGIWQRTGGVEREGALFHATLRSEHCPRFPQPLALQHGCLEYWDAIDVPILVVRAQKSDLLPEAVLKDMMRRKTC